MRVTAKGTKSFVLNYRVRGSGRERRITIGRFPNWTVGAARIEARRLQRLVDAGHDPLGDLQDERSAPTVTDLIERFDQEHIGPRLRPGSARNYRVLLTKHVSPHFGAHTKAADVVFADIDSLHRKITKTGSTYAANRCVAILSKMFALAVRWNMRADNPCVGVGRNYEAKRKRYLSGDELARLVKALAAYPDQQVANIVRLLLMTGARAGEVFAMRWGDLSQTTERDKSGLVVNRMIWTKLASTTKQKADHTVPLGAPAQQLLTEIRAQQTGEHRALGTFVFPTSNNVTGHVLSIERAWKTICKAAEIGGLRVHDLRHSFASQLVSSGASLPLIGALLGHASPNTTARYSHFLMIRCGKRSTASVPSLPMPGRKPRRSR